MTRTTMPPKELESPPMQSAPCPGRLVEDDLGILGARKAERHHEDPDRRHLARLRVGKRRPLPEIDLGRLPGTEIQHDRGRFAFVLSSLGLPEIAELSIAPPGFRGSAPGPDGWPAPRSCPDATQESGLTKGGRSIPPPAGSRALQTPSPDRCRPARTFPSVKKPFRIGQFPDPGEILPPQEPGLGNLPARGPQPHLYQYPANLVHLEPLVGHAVLLYAWNGDPCRIEVQELLSHTRAGDSDPEVA